MVPRKHLKKCQLKNKLSGRRLLWHFREQNGSESWPDLTEHRPLACRDRDNARGLVQKCRPSCKEGCWSHLPKCPGEKRAYYPQGLFPQDCVRTQRDSVQLMSYTQQHSVTQGGMLAFLPPTLLCCEAGTEALTVAPQSFTTCASRQHYQVIRL